MGFHHITLFKTGISFSIVELLSSDQNRGVLELQRFLEAAHNMIFFVQIQQYRPAALPVPMKPSFISGQCNQFKCEKLSEGTKGIDCVSKTEGIFEKQPVPLSSAPQNKMLSSHVSNIRLLYEVRI